MKRALRRRYGRAVALRLWRHNRTTGLWVVERTVTPETADEWLKVFRRDEPNETFVVSATKPKAEAWAKWHPGDQARTTSRVPADPYPLFAPALVVVEEVVKHKPKRRKDAFGDWETSGGGTRVKVRVEQPGVHQGKSYWVDEEILERT